MKMNDKDKSIVKMPAGSGSELQCAEILKQVQDDRINDFYDSLVSQAIRVTG
jgi:hypothetical protein